MLTFLILVWLAVGAFAATRRHGTTATPVLRTLVTGPFGLLRQDNRPVQTQPWQQPWNPAQPHPQQTGQWQQDNGWQPAPEPAAAEPTTGQAFARQGLSLVRHLAVFGLAGGFGAAVLIAILTASLGGDFGQQFFAAIIFGFLGFIAGLFFGLIVWGVRGWVSTGKSVYAASRPEPYSDPIYQPAAPQQAETATLPQPGTPPSPHNDPWSGENPYGCCMDWTDENGYPSHGSPGCLHPQAPANQN